MLTTKRLVLTMGLAALISSGCTWVKPTAEAEQVQVLTSEQVSKCKEIGKTTASLADKILGFKRNATKVQRELEILGRNSAANIGGDAIVPISKVKEGQQIFAVYKCLGVTQYNNDAKK